MQNLPDIQALYQMKYLHSNRESIDAIQSNPVQKAKLFHRKIMSNFDGMKKVQCVKIIKEKQNMGYHTQSVFVGKQKIEPNEESNSSPQKHITSSSNHKHIKKQNLRKILKLSQPQMVQLQHKMGGQRNLTYLLNNFYERKHKIRQTSRKQNKKQMKPKNNYFKNQYQQMSQYEKIKQIKYTENRYHAKQNKSTEKQSHSSRPLFRKINEFRCNLPKSYHNSLHIPRCYEHEQLNFVINDSQKIQKSKVNNMIKNDSLNIKELAPWSVVDLQSA